MKFKFLLLIVVQLVLVLCFVSADIQQLLDLWINEDITYNAMFDELDNLEEKLLQEDEDWENLYWRSRTAMIRGQILYENKQKKESVAELEKSQELMFQSIAMKEYSDSWRILAESSSLIMIQKDIGYIIKNFSKSQEQAGTALELDPQNARASLVIAQFLGAAPKIAGGSRTKAVELLQELSVRKNLSNEDRFYILTSLAQFLKKDKKYEEAAAACREALDLYPGNTDARTQLSEIMEKI